MDNKALKNRGMERSDVDERREAVSELTETEFGAIASYPFNGCVGTPGMDAVVLVSDMFASKNIGSTNWSG